MQTLSGKHLTLLALRTISMRHFDDAYADAGVRIVGETVAGTSIITNIETCYVNPNRITKVREKCVTLTDTKGKKHKNKYFCEVYIDDPQVRYFTVYGTADDLVSNTEVKIPDYLVHN